MNVFNGRKSWFKTWFFLIYYESWRHLDDVWVKFWMLFQYSSANSMPDRLVERISLKNWIRSNWTKIIERTRLNYTISMYGISTLNYRLLIRTSKSLRVAFSPFLSLVVCGMMAKYINGRWIRTFEIVRIFLSIFVYNKYCIVNLCGAHWFRCCAKAPHG